MGERVRLEVTLYQSLTGFTLVFDRKKEEVPWSSPWESALIPQNVQKMAPGAWEALAEDLRERPFMDSVCRVEIPCLWASSSASHRIHTGNGASLRGAGKMLVPREGQVWDGERKKLAGMGVRKSNGTQPHVWEVYKHRNCQRRSRDPKARRADRCHEGKNQTMQRHQVKNNVFKVTGIKRCLE